MPIAQSRRRFMTSAAAAGDAALIGSARALAEEGPRRRTRLPARLVELSLTWPGTSCGSVANLRLLRVIA
jgi:hypothetical protein